MSVTAAQGFIASGVKAGLKKSGNHDIALVVNQGPMFTAAGVFTSNRFKAAPVLWSQQVLLDQCIRSVVLNSGGANACTGAVGFADTHHTAEFVAEKLTALGTEVGAGEIAVLSLIHISEPTRPY